MRLAILADIHANLPALQAVLADADRQGAQGIIVAGDLIAGPQPIESIRLLRERESWMIRGNTDSSLLAYDAGQAPPSRAVSKQFALMRWSHRHLDRGTMDYLRSLPQQGVFRAPGPAIRVVHGSPRDPAESIYPDVDLAVLDQALALVDEPVLVCGHTHEPWQQVRQGRLALNPGSVANPLDGRAGTQYALLTLHDGRWRAELRHLSYDVAQVRRAFAQSGLLAEGGPLARAFLLSIETGCNVGEDFRAYARGLAAQAGASGVDAVPDPIWEQAAETYDWAEAASGHLSFYKR